MSIATQQAVPRKDIRGLRFEQKALQADLQQAIAGQALPTKAILTVALGLFCWLATVLMAVLMATAGLEIVLVGATQIESLLTVTVVTLWLAAAIYQSYRKSFLVCAVGVGIAIAFHALLIRFGASAPAAPFFISTPITILIVWTIIFLVFNGFRLAIATVDLLYVRSRWPRLVGLLIITLGAVLGAKLAVYTEDVELHPHASEIALISGVGFSLAVALGAGWANRQHNVPWHHPDWLREWALAFSCWGGTSFHNLDLSRINFTDATLANTDLRGRSLYRTCFRQAKRLERARTDNRYLDLDNLKVQSLLTNGTSEDTDFSCINLQGADLREATLQSFDLTEANLSGADLRGANLEGAMLIQTQMVDADLSGARLTDACIQDWNINQTTRFKGVHCQRIYLKRSTKGHFLEPRPERGTFQPGEFEQWITEFQRTISLIFQQSLNREALAFALTQTAINYENPDLLSVQRMVNQEDGALVAEISVSSDTDKAEVYQQLTDQYQTAVKQLEAGYQLTLQAKDAEIERFSQLFKDLYTSQQELMQGLAVNVANSKSRVVIQGENNQIYMIEQAGDISVTNHQNINAGGNVDLSSGNRINVGGDMSGSVDLSSGAKVSIGGDVVGSTINLGELSGQVSTRIQQLRDTTVNGADELADLLGLLQTAIAQDTSLSNDQKKEALEAVETLAEEGKKPPEHRVTKLCTMAVNALKGVAATVADVSKLTSALQSSLPPLIALLGL